MAQRCDVLITASSFRKQKLAAWFISSLWVSAVRSVKMFSASESLPSRELWLPLESPLSPRGNRGGGEKLLSQSIPPPSRVCRAGLQAMSLKRKNHPCATPGAQSPSPTQWRRCLMQNAEVAPGKLSHDVAKSGMKGLLTQPLSF